MPSVRHISAPAVLFIVPTYRQSVKTANVATPVLLAVPNKLSGLEILSQEDAGISLLNRAAQLEEDDLKNFGISME